ncbi:uncharacterized protein CEXT_162551 [Caerostris extrusa]|uniref:Uncharacterized protein n=1 Tax=Caerostris extrusa TaxID=172846 RepID=A0AAV4XEQ1_CAEEX|nr:uncharacterized protein CEXT_162551 [Caerostris extrusa]
MVVNIKFGCTFSLLIQVITLFKILRSEILDFETILPPNPQDYDNLQPPKEKGDATVVRFHVTVLSLDTIDEGSMVPGPNNGIYSANSALPGVHEERLLCSHILTQFETNILKCDMEWFIQTSLSSRVHRFIMSTSQNYHVELSIRTESVR